MSIFKNKYTNFFKLLKNEKKSEDELIYIQNSKLKKLINHAFYNVPFYNKILKEKEVHPDDINSIEDLNKLPIISKNNFHEYPESFFLSKNNLDKKNLIPINTSGSSGISLRFYIDYEYDQLRKAQYLRPYYSNNRKPRDKVLRFLNTPVAQGNWFQKLGYFVEHQVYSDSNADGQLETIQSFQPDIIQGFGSCLAMLASKIRQDDIKITYPRIIFTDSELLTERMRKQIQDVFRSELLDVYGTFETDNIAYECHQHEGYHIASDCVIMEFIKEGRQVAPGESGEIVCTVLDNFAMPFIRYNLKDIGKYSDKKCPCGRNFPIMEMVDGRADDCAVHQNGILVSPRSFLGFFDPLAEYLHEYQIIQEKINKFTVRVVPNDHFGEEHAGQIKRNLKKEFPDAQVNVLLVKSIDRDKSGKLMAFKSLVRS